MANLPQVNQIISESKEPMQKPDIQAEIQSHLSSIQKVCHTYKPLTIKQQSGRLHNPGPIQALSSNE